MIDFINFYGGIIEYIDFNKNIKSAVVQIKEKDKFKIFISNDYCPKNIKEKWEKDFNEELSDTKLPKSLYEHYKKIYELGPDYTILNMELTKAFASYIFAKKSKNFSMDDIIITRNGLSIISKEEIETTKQRIKKLI